MGLGFAMRSDNHLYRCIGLARVKLPDNRAFVPDADAIGFRIVNPRKCRRHVKVAVVLYRKAVTAEV
jgi:hypothetical protein